MSRPDPPYPTFAVFRAILVLNHGCFVEPPPQNLAYSPRQFNILKRRAKDGTVFECPPFPMNDDEVMTLGMIMYICRHLRIPFLVDPTAVR